MVMNEKLVSQLIRQEGLHLKPYRCPAGKLTIGVGRNLDDVGISNEEALEFLRHDIENAAYEVAHLLADYVILRDQIGYARFAALINLAFNMGADGLSSFKKMFAALKRCDWDEAADQLLDSRYHDQVGERADELARQIRFGRFD